MIDSTSPKRWPSILVSASAPSSIWPEGITRAVRRYHLSKSCRRLYDSEVVTSPNGNRRIIARVHTTPQRPPHNPRVVNSNNIHYPTAAEIFGFQRLLFVSTYHAARPWERANRYVLPCVRSSCWYGSVDQTTFATGVGLGSFANRKKYSPLSL
jgi:hypothetical protein